MCQLIPGKLKSPINKRGYLLFYSDVVLEDRPWPRGSSRTKNLVLGLGLGLESSGLGLEGRGLGLGLGLEGPGPWPWSWPRGSWP